MRFRLLVNIIYIKFQKLIKQSVFLSILFTVVTQNFRNALKLIIVFRICFTYMGFTLITLFSPNIFRLYIAFLINPYFTIFICYLIRNSTLIFRNVNHALIYIIVKYRSVPISLIHYKMISMGVYISAIICFLCITINIQIDN